VAAFLYPVSSTFGTLILCSHIETSQLDTNNKAEESVHHQKVKKEADKSAETQDNPIFRAVGFACKQQELKTAEYL
jgi:hypothetical protein